MNVGGLRLGHPSDDELDTVLLSAQSAAPTYDHMGSTLDPLRWAGAEVSSRHLVLGCGLPAFEAGREALRTWVPQAGIGASIHPEAQLVEAGATVLVVLRRGPFYVIAPNRVIDVLDEPGIFGFAYGSLPGHPERGEESFVVEHLADGTVRATIRAQAGPGTLAAQAVAPLVRHLQSAAIDGYLRAIAGHVAKTPAPGDPR